MGGPLAGVRVVELAGIGPAPFAGMLLADLGADVLRLQRPDPGALAAAQAGGFGGGGTSLVMGVLAGLLEARATGRGRVVDAAIVDGASSLAALMHGQRAAGTWHDARGTNLLDGSAPFYTVYECAGGGHV